MTFGACQKPTAWLLAGLLLFAQAIAVVQACTSEATPVMAFSSEVAEMHDCESGSPAVAENPNACLQHCTSGDQTPAYSAAVMVGPPAGAVLVVQVPAPDASVLLRESACELQSPDPPPSIRFCSYQL
jgi:hypothetical protein